MPRLLLVEDSGSDVALITANLTRGGHWTWDVAHTLQDALQKLTVGEYAAILLDLGLPDVRGEDALRMLGDRFRLPVVVLTGQPEDVLGAHLVRLGAQDFLTKDEINGPSLERALRYAVERHERDIELTKARHRLAHYAHAVAHDLRSPLASIRGFAEMIMVEVQTTAPVNPRAEAYCARIIDNSKHLSRMVTELLADAEAPSRRSVVDLGTASSWAADLLAARAQQVRARITLGVLPRMVGDETALRHALVNLLSNALNHAVAEDLLIEITGHERDDGGWDLRVEDNGCQVDEALVAKGQPIVLSGPEGTWDQPGLGLRSVAEVAASHDGQVWLGSGTLGGLRVSLAFPPSRFEEAGQPVKAREAVPPTLDPR